MTETEVIKLIKSCVKEILNEGLQGLKKRDLKNIVHVNWITGISEEDNIKSIRRIKEMIFRLLKNHYPWMLEYKYPSTIEHSSHGWFYPFAQFFVTNYDYDDWLHDFCREIIRQRSGANPEASNIPTFDEDTKKVYEYASELFALLATNPISPRNYPIFVSLYSVSERYGGPEEGGWNYTWTEFVRSIKVNNYKESRSAIVKLLKNLKNDRGDYIDNPKIYLEKISGHLQSMESPHYG